MDTNVTVAIVTGSSTALVAIVALVTNTYWIRHSIQELSRRIDRVEARMDRLEDRFNQMQDLILGKLSAIDVEIARLMDKTGLK